MKKFLFLLALLCIEKALHAQQPYVYTIKADSVKITNTCDTAELIIENHTQTVPGFLFNKGRGRTEFRRIAQLDDTSVVIGGDTIHLGRGNKNFANADLTFTGDRVHNGMYKYLNLNDFGGIYLKTKSHLGWPDAELTLDTLDGFKLTMTDNTTTLPISSSLQIYPDTYRLDIKDDNQNLSSYMLLYPGEMHYKLTNSGATSASLDINTYGLSMATSAGSSQAGFGTFLSQDGDYTLNFNTGNGITKIGCTTSSINSHMDFVKGDSIIIANDNGQFLKNTRYVQYPDKFVFRNGNGVNDFRLVGLPASTTTADSMLVVDNNGQVKKRSQSPTRKSATVTASSYTVPADVDVVFVNYTGGTATITLPSGTLDREITIKNLNTTNSVALSGLDASESNSIATRGAITVKYTGSAWVGISKY